MENIRRSHPRLWTHIHTDPSSRRGRRSTLRWFRAGKSRGRLDGFLVTWDVDSRDRAACARLQRFVYGYALVRDSKTYRYAGFVERDGVRYLGQSVLLVKGDLVPELTRGLSRIGIEFEVDRGSVG